MIEVKIPKEINRYETKAVGPFTLRQLLCIAICLPVGVGVYVLSKPHVGDSLAGFLVFIPGGIAYLFGWYKPYGMRFEKYMQTVFVGSFLAPNKRIYKTENYYAGLLREIQKAEADEAEVQMAANGKKTKPAKTKKYKRSKEAIL